MCSSRGAAVASSVRDTWARSTSSVGGSQPSLTTTAATTALAQPLVGKSEDRAIADGGMGAQRGLDRLRQHGQPAGADRVVGAAQHGKHARIVDGAEIVGAKPARLGERVGIDRVAIALGQRRAADHDAPVGGQPQPDSVQRDAVVDAAPGGLAHPVGAHHRNARRRGGIEDRPRRRSAADQYGVQFGQRGRRRRIGQGLGQLRGDQRRVPPTGPNRLTALGNSATSNPAETSSSTGAEPASTLRTNTCTPAM